MIINQESTLVQSYVFVVAQPWIDTHQLTTYLKETN